MIEGRQRNNKTSSQHKFRRWHIRDGRVTKGRFGFALASLGDLDRDGYKDDHDDDQDDHDDDHDNDNNEDLVHDNDNNDDLVHDDGFQVWRPRGWSSVQRG